MKLEAIPIGSCQCGCGEQTGIANRNRNGYKKGQPLRFLRGHIGRLNALAITKRKIKIGKDGRTRKLCTCCGHYRLLEEEFNKSTTRLEQRRTYCKHCERKQARKFYRKNSEPYKRRARAFNKQRSAWRLAEADRVKESNGCLICKETTLCILDFHHRHGNSKGREGGMPVMRAACFSNRRFLRELSKCVILCANCHRKVHAGVASIPESSMNLALLIREYPR